MEQQQTASNDLAKTFRFQREQITTRFTREPVDADDTVPVALYSSPYERIEISTASPEADDAPAPSRSFRLVLALSIASILCLTFALGVGFAYLVL
jgi:hypothetical protein